MRRFLSILLAMTICLPMLPAGAKDLDGITKETGAFGVKGQKMEASEQSYSSMEPDNEESGLLDWESRSSLYRSIGTEWPWRPAKDYISQQNPPDFSWPYIANAVSYDLKICHDKELGRIAYQATGLQKNYYNFFVPFAEGTYYWSVRYHTDSGRSKWTEASRFTIEPGASQFTVDPIDTMISKIPAAHPRIAVGPKNLEAYRNLPGGKSYLSDITARVRKFMEEPLPEEPKTAEDLRNAVSPMLNRISNASLAYLLGQNTEIGQYAVSILMALASWDPNGTTSYVNQDQAFRDIMINLVQGYDYLYPLLTDEQRLLVRNMILIRVKTLEHPTEGLSDAAYKLKESPYMSHGGTGQSYILLTSIAMYGEFPEAEQWLREYLPMYLNMVPVWGNEDGGWAQGTGYAETSFTMGEDLRFTLYTHGMANVYKKAFYKNIDKFGIYNLGKYAGAEFGDQSLGSFNPTWALAFKAQAYFLQSPYSAWLRNNCGYGAAGAYSNYYMSSFPWPSPKSPEELPKAAVFQDIGLVSMHSSLTDYNNRVSAYFKSSPFGAYNHSHPDQNSFIIQAYGERLAIDSGYYDYYFSPFDMRYNRKTYAHNAITMDGGTGQAPTVMVSKGKITNFINHPFFNLASGDATEAYNYDLNYSTGYPIKTARMEKAKRHMIYIRPDTFIVIDDLKRSGDAKSSFEWWLNSLNTISYTDQSAKIVQGKAEMDTQIQYPKHMKADYKNNFSGPDGVIYTPSGSFANKPVHKRVWFSTPPVNSTKIISTLSVHPSGTQAAPIISEQTGNVMKLVFFDGTAAYIRTDDTMPMAADQIETDAAAVVVKGDSIMAVDATILKKNGKIRFSSDSPVSVSLGEGTLNVSCTSDSNVVFPSLRNVQTLTDEKGRSIPQGQENYGVMWQQTENELSVSLYNGFYTLSINK